MHQQHDPAGKQIYHYCLYIVYLKTVIGHENSTHAGDYFLAKRRTRISKESSHYLCSMEFGIFFLQVEIFLRVKCQLLLACFQLLLETSSPGTGFELFLIVAKNVAIKSTLRFCIARTQLALPHSWKHFMALSTMHASQDVQTIFLFAHILEQLIMETSNYLYLAMYVSLLLASSRKSHYSHRRKHENYAILNFYLLKFIS